MIVTHVEWCFEEVLYANMIFAIKLTRLYDAGSEPPCIRSIRP